MIFPASAKTTAMAITHPKILVVIPVYNHGKTVVDVIRKCLGFHPDILVVDDGSTDLAETALDGLDIRVVRHRENRGKGAAIMTAAAEAARLGMTHIITLDADGQHHSEDLALFKKAIMADPLALYVGKRDFSSSTIPGSSRFGRRFSNFWFRVQTGLPIGDAQCGFRAYPLFVLENLKLRGHHYSFEVEVLVKSSWAGVKIKDIDISVYYPPKAEHVSHFKRFRDNARLTHLNTLLTFRSFMPVAHKKLVKNNDIKFSFYKPLKSIKLMLAHNVSPGTIALSGAAGVFLGALPLIAVHTLVILFVAGFFRLNKVVAVGASQLCMPPVVPALCIETGYFLTHKGTFLTNVSYETFGHQAGDRLLEWVLGSLFVAPILGAIVFFLLFCIARMLLYIGRK